MWPGRWKYEVKQHKSKVILKNEELFDIKRYSLNIVNGLLETYLRSIALPEKNINLQQDKKTTLLSFVTVVDKIIIRWTNHLRNVQGRKLLPCRSHRKIVLRDDAHRVITCWRKWMHFTFHGYHHLPWNTWNLFTLAH